jgi:hypothetical protein
VSGIKNYVIYLTGAVSYAYVAFPTGSNTFRMKMYEL